LGKGTNLGCPKPIDLGHSNRGNGKTTRGLRFRNISNRGSNHKDNLRLKDNLKGEKENIDGRMTKRLNLLHFEGHS
jgi:hypothetical protein